MDGAVNVKSYIRSPGRSEPPDDPRGVAGGRYEEGPEPLPHQSLSTEAETKADDWQVSTNYHRRSVEASAREEDKVALKYAKAALNLFPNEAIYLVRAARCLQASGFQDKALDAVRLARVKLQSLSCPSQEQSSAVTRAWRYFFPFDDFPQELILEIFDHCHSERPKRNPLVVLQICSTWRTLALKQVSLWRDTSLFPPSSALSEIFCKNNTTILVERLRFCGERSGHSIQNLIVQASPCQNEFREILSLASASKNSLKDLHFRFEAGSSLCRQCSLDEVEASVKQLELVADSLSLESVSLTLYRPLLVQAEGMEQLSMLRTKLEARKKPLSHLSLALKESEDQMRYADLLEPLLVGVKSLSVKLLKRPDLAIRPAVAWKAAAICSHSLERAHLPSLVSERGPAFALGDVVTAGTAFPLLHSLVLTSTGRIGGEPSPAEMPAQLLELPALENLETEVIALAAFDTPAVKTANLEVLFLSDINRLSYSLQRWTHLKCLTLYVEDVATGDDLIVKTLRMLADLLSPVSKASTACPELSRLRVSCQGRAYPLSRGAHEEVMANIKEQSCSREEWETLPRLESSIVQMVHDRRRASQGSLASVPSEVAVARPFSAFTRGKRHKGAAQESVKWAPCISIDHITFQGWYVDPKLWAAFIEKYPGEAECVPDPLELEHKPYHRPVKPKRGERRVHAW